MYYFKRHIGDYSKKAGRLSMLQDGAYTRLMDCCYEREDFPTKTEAIEWTWASNPDEVQAVHFILARFFKLHTVGQFKGKYVQNRILEELNQYWEFCEIQRLKGKKGGRPKIEKQKPDSKEKKPAGINQKAGGKPEGSKKNPNHEPLTNNQDKNKEEDLRLARWMFDLILKVMPKSKEPNFDNWADTIRLMRERDGNTLHEIAATFKWANSDDFWQTNIRSPEKLRSQFATLDAKREKHEKSGPIRKSTNSRSSNIDDQLREKFQD